MRRHARTQRDVTAGTGHLVGGDETAASGCARNPKATEHWWKKEKEDFGSLSETVDEGDESDT